ncbi:MAG: pilus assembly protein PilB [Planctomycetota bacterium]|nr:MAG: pilus assembly protein PilB [Planctomycetota bacterium]
MAKLVKKLGEILVDLGRVKPEDVKRALAIQDERGGAIGEILVSMGACTRADVHYALGIQQGMEVVDLRTADVPAEALEKVPKSVAEIYRIVPLGFDSDGVFTVAMADPQNLHILDDLRFMLNCEVKGAVSSEKEVMEAIERLYGSEGETLEDIIAAISNAEGLDFDDAESIDLETLQKAAGQRPIIEFLNLILLQAIKARASDIHFEPFEREFKVRYRVDGILYEMTPPPKHLALPITSRIKVMANLDISERRLPQDGRIDLVVGGNPVDLRVSTLPTIFGESVVMRVLDRSVISLDLEEVGFSEAELESFRRLIKRPHGIVLVTGPTGSGKTTTLYSALNELNSVEVKIITTEDPVEYEIEGLIQIPINPDIGVTFASCLRSILRHDPDIILVGEIRDLETAEIAIEASLTGHLVFSTLHTNDAPTAITRLIDLGVEPFLISATLEAVIAQRLVRKICPRCKTPYTPTPEMLMELGLKPDEVEGRQFYYGKGCEFCNHTGYKGRTAIFETMMMNRELRELVAASKPTEVIRAKALEYGMHTLREAGIIKIFDGITTIEEVVRETLLEW